MNNGSNKFSEYNWIFALTVIFSIFGLMMVLSASFVVQLEQTGDSIWGQTAKQFAGIVVGFFGIMFLSNLPISKYEKLKIPAIWIVNAAILFTIVFGSKIGGNKNWLSVPFAGQVQPSELAKPVFLVVLGLQLAKRMNLLGRLETPFDAFECIPSKQKRDEIKAQNPGKTIPFSFWFRYGWSRPDSRILLALSACLIGIGVQGDLGTLLVYAIAIMGLFWICGVKGRFYFMAFAGLGAAVGGLVLLSPNRTARFAVALLNCSTAEKAAGLCDQRTHAINAIATGGLIGVGPGASREKWGRLAAAHNDFIFAVIAEELGFIGAVAVIIAFIFLAFLMVRAISHQNNLQAKFVGCGIALWIIGQAMLNIIVVTFPFAPVIGVTLPFISYGGSSIVSVLFGMGVMLAMCRVVSSRPTAADSVKKAIDNRRAGKIQVVAGGRR